MCHWFHRRCIKDEVRHSVETSLLRALTHVYRRRLVGFDELKGGDDFNTKTLEIGMIHCGALQLSFLRLFSRETSSDSEC